LAVSDASYSVPSDWEKTPYGEKGLIKLNRGGVDSVWSVDNEARVLRETLTVAKLADGSSLYNGAPKADGRFFQVGSMSEIRYRGRIVTKTGPLEPTSFLQAIRDSKIVRWPSEKIQDGENQVTVYHQVVTAGTDILRPGVKFKVGGSPIENLDFISLMLALFLGTAALPHILIRYYTVPSPACARKSTIVAIAAIGFFYMLTLFMGLGAMTSGVLDLTDSNMAAPLLAKSFGIFLFAIITALAFATVLGTVSGLIVAASGAIAHDLLDRFMGIKMSDHGKVTAGKLAAIGIGIIAMFLGVKYKGMNVSYLVGWAFAVAASANLPAIIMLLFWRKTTSQGIAASIVVGMVAALGIILMSPEMYKELYGLDPKTALFALNSPTIVSVPLSFATLVVVSLATQRRRAAVPYAEPVAPETVPALEPALAHTLAASGDGIEHLSHAELVSLVHDLRAEIANLKGLIG
jgi:cation/acetate symporter